MAHAPSDVVKYAENARPETLPLRIIEALGNSAADCIRQLQERNLNPARYEFALVPPPY